jgi:hypothetical protein
MEGVTNTAPHGMATREKREYLHCGLSSFSPFILPEPPASEMVPPIFRVRLLLLVNPV